MASKRFKFIFGLIVGFFISIPFYLRTFGAMYSDFHPEYFFPLSCAVCVISGLVFTYLLESYW
jgi:hypothetical protein